VTGSSQLLGHPSEELTRGLRVQQPPRQLPRLDSRPQMALRHKTLSPFGEEEALAKGRILESCGGLEFRRGHPLSMAQQLLRSLGLAMAT